MNPQTAKQTDWKLDPVLMMFAALAIAVVMTWLVPSGKFARESNGLVKPGTYSTVNKDISRSALLPRVVEGAGLKPASPAAILTAIPAGMVKAASLIFMITALGGMFGVLRTTGTLEVSIDRLLAFTGGSTGLLTTLLMIAISVGSTFLGLISEYLLIIPLFLALSKRLGLQPMFGFAIVTVSAKIGYIASVANPVILMVAQPIAGLPIFSGFVFRLVLWVVFMAVGIFYVMRLAREPAVLVTQPHATPLSGRHTAIIAILGTAVVTLVYCAAERDWRDSEFAAFYLLMALLIAAVGGLAPRRAVHCLVDGMRSMMLAGFLVGMAKGVEVILQNGQILDTIVNQLATWASHLPRAMIAMALVFIEMILGLLIPSGSAKAAISMPILVPVAHVAGISGQTTVLAYLMGNGLINMFAPTSGMLLAYLATADISYGKWLRYSLPLFLILTVLALVAVYVAVAIGY
ncbi:MAG: YfcC family protein [Opitutaceae bacterium]|nr:YfcC family protein [Opitutaceae bacterium]